MSWLASHRQQVVFLLLLLATGVTVQWAYPRLHPQWIAYRQGERALERRDYDQAAQALARAVELGARIPKVWLLLGQANLAADRPEPARAAFLELSRLRPHDPDVLQLLIGLDERLGQPRRALERLAELEQAGGLDAAQQVRLAELHLRLSDLEGAERALRRALAARPDDAPAALRLAEVLAWRKQYAEAQALLEGVLQKNPANVQARLHLARLLSWQGKIQAAIAQYRLALGEKP